jgi:adenosine deaminase
MDNLRSAIEILFLKQDPRELLIEHRAWKNLVSSVDKAFFTEGYLAANRPFSVNHTEQLYALLNETWMKDGHYDASVFHVLLVFAKQVLRVKDGVPICKYEHYLRWHEMTSAIGEDILTCSFLADDDKKTKTKRESFAWNTILESDNTHLEALFRRGLSELHCHLNGSSINFDLNWLAIMNEPEYQKPEWFKKASGHHTPLYDYAILAAFIRMYLFLHIEGYLTGSQFEKDFKLLWNDPNRLQILPMYISKLQSEITCQLALHAHKFNVAEIDYAIPIGISVPDSKKTASLLLVGERRLMYECFRRLYNEDETIPGLGILFYIYLVVKLQVKGLIIQHNGVKGFANFKRFDRNKEVFVNHSRNKKLQEMIPRMALESYRQDSHINYFEYRIAPKDTASAMKAKLNQMRILLGDNEKANCVIHFIKDKEQERRFTDSVANWQCCRNFEGRIEYRRKSRVLEILLRSYDHRIVGIDAANSEFGCRPEVFAEIYRRLQHLQRDTSYEKLFDVEWYDLGITYHVGEDYYDIVDGMRAIDEAILFLNLQDGARLGHAVALGIGTMDYYRERKHTIIIPKQDLLDNCVWLLAKMDEYAIQEEKGVRNQLRFEVQRLMSEIYQNYSMEDYRIYYQSWLLRGDEPSVYMNASKQLAIPEDTMVEPYYLNHFEKKIDIARNQWLARVLYRDYHYDAGVKHRGHKPEEWRLPVGLVSVIDKIQMMMRNDVARRKIAIEVNPTSNLRICNIDTYDTHPVVKFRNYGLSVMDEHNDCPQISVSINTDDKGIFATSLEKEYTLMALALEKQKTAEGKMKFLPNNVQNWLEGIRQEAEVQRFRK